MAREVLLIFPPFVDPRAPYLAVPSLVAYLRGHNVPVRAVDLNLRWFCDMLRADFLRTILPDSAESRFVIDRIDAAISTFRDIGSFRRVEKYVRARNIMDVTLLLISREFHGWELSLRNPTSADRTISEITKIISSKEDTPFRGLLDKYVIDLSNEVDPETLIGISVSNMSQLYPALYLATSFKRRGCTVLIGGATVTLLRDHFLSWKPFVSFIDGAVIFEGEETLREIWNNFLREEYLFRGISNCIYSMNDQLCLQRSSLPLDLDELPTPDFSDLPLCDYFSPQPVLPLISSKGCIWGRCTFCSIPSSSSSGTERSRVRSIDKISQDIYSLKRKHGVTDFFFVDENIEQGRLFGIAKRLSTEKAGVNWIAFSRFEKSLTQQIADTLAAGGCKKLLMGLESASNRILRLMKKGTTLSMAEANLERLSAAGIAVNLFCITGFPSETRLEMEETLNFILNRISLLRRPGFSCSFSEFVLDPWSPLGLEAKEMGGNPKFSGERSISKEMRKKFNFIINDAALPLEMVGWEEHSLLMITCDAHVYSTERVSMTYITQRLRRADSLRLCSSAWFVLESAGELNGKAKSLIINIRNARTLSCTGQVIELLQRFANPIFVQAVFEAYGTNPLKPPEQLLGAMAILWRNGFLNEVSLDAK